MLRTRKEMLQQLSNHVVADAYFSKLTFVDGALEMGFHVISRFRDDACLRYLTRDKPSGGKGRPKLYDGKIDMGHLEEDRLTWWQNVKQETGGVAIGAIIVLLFVIVWLVRRNRKKQSSQ